MIFTFTCIYIVTNNKEFPNWMAFQKWKEEEETFTSFVQPKGKTAGPANGMLCLMRSWLLSESESSQLRILI